jgi:hypothetical protein
MRSTLERGRAVAISANLTPCFCQSEGARLCFIGHGLMENRCGLIVDARLTRVSGHAERLAAFDMVQHVADHPCATTLGPNAVTMPPTLRRLYRGTARPERAPARGAEHQRSAPGDRQAHDTTSELCREPAHPQTHREGLRLYQGVGGLRQTSWSQDCLDLLQFVGFGDSFKRRKRTVFEHHFTVS